MQFAPSTRWGRWVLGTAGDCENIWTTIASPTQTHSFLSCSWPLVKCWTMLDTCVMHPYASLLFCVNDKVYMWNCLSCFVVLFTPPCCTISGKVWRRHSSELWDKMQDHQNHQINSKSQRATSGPSRTPCAVWNAEVWNILHHFHPKEQAGRAAHTHNSH